MGAILGKPGTVEEQKKINGAKRESPYLRKFALGGKSREKPVKRHLPADHEKRNADGRGETCGSKE